MVLPIDTTKILAILASAVTIMVTIQGLKNLFPAFFTAHPKVSQIIAAILSLLTSLAVCLHGGIDIACVITAVVTFLGAVGIYHSVAQAGGSVQAPLPPAPPAPPK